MSNVCKSIAFFLLCLTEASAYAEILSSQMFKVKGGELGYFDRKEIYAAWNANDPAAVLKPGMKIMFFGRGEGCDKRAAGGPVKAQGSPRFSQALGLTGIPLAPEGKGYRWAPSANTSQCDNAIQDQVGDSFVHINDDSVNGGIGLFTFTGPDQTGRLSFFRQFDKDGKNGSGANAYIEGTFVAFRFDWQNGKTVRPWSGDSQSIDKRKAEFRSIQSVAVAAVGDEVGGRSEEAVQAKQQFIVAFINRPCFLRDGAKKGLCQLQYLFNTAVYRAGVNNWGTAQWFKSAGLFFDPAQNGMAVIHGPIGAAGEVSSDMKSGLDLYTSLGEPSRHDVFKDKDFRVQVSFSQLKNALRIIAALQLNKSPNQVNLSDFVMVFGEHWDDPNEWLLLSANVSQEVHNPRRDVRASIGGNVKEISIGVAPQ